MAPRAGSRRSQAPNDRIFELGVQGRKTGVTLRDTGVRDEHGMQPLEDIFSSPEKTGRVEAAEESDESSDQEMDIENTTAPDPAMLMRSHGNALKMPLPRSRSPIKTNLQSPARQNPSLNPDSSPVRGSIVGQNERTASQSVKRKLDFSMDAGARQRNARPSSSSKGGANGAGSRTNGTHNGFPAEDADDDEVGESDEEAILHGEQQKGDAEESMAIVDEDGDDGGAGPDLDDQYHDASDDVDLGENSLDGPESEPRAASSRNTNKKPNGARPAEEADEDEEPVRKKRGRPAKGQAAASRDDQERGPAKRRRRESSAEPEPEEEAEEGVEEEAGPAEPSRQRGKKGRKPTAASQAAKPSAARAGKTKKTTAPTKAAAGAKGGRGRPRRSSGGAADTSLAVVPRGPPLPKSRGGLLINRREVPGEDGSMTRTRSGRNSYKPLAFWRNEHVDYDQEQTMSDAFGPRSHPSKFVLPTIKEVHRVEEPEPERSSRRRGRPTTTAASKAGKKKRRAADMFDEPAEPWEEDPGTVVGDAVVWQPEYDYAPPGLDEEVEVAQEQLAVAGAAIETGVVRNADFRYAKTLSLPFFGAGVVDLPPGAEKRPKNSRRMFMAFFVFSGTVLVTVNESSFRIGKGGMWFVPRGNIYRIQNDYDEPARVFFSQGCEPAEQPPEEEGG